MQYGMYRCLIRLRRLLPTKSIKRKIETTRIEGQKFSWNTNDVYVYAALRVAVFKWEITQHRLVLFKGMNKILLHHMSKFTSTCLISDLEDPVNNRVNHAEVIVDTSSLFNCIWNLPPINVSPMTDSITFSVIHVRFRSPQHSWYTGNREATVWRLPINSGLS